jgi:dienelactone hydrolase
LEYSSGNGAIPDVQFMIWAWTFYACSLDGFPGGLPGPGNLIRILFCFFLFRPYLFGNPSSRSNELYRDREKMRALIGGALEKAESMGADTGNAVVMGYCFGGAAVLEYARSGADIKGFVTFHGGLSTQTGQNYAKTRGRLLILHGGADAVVTMDDFSGLARELEQAGVPHEMIVYGGAPHAFSVFGGDHYRKDADRKSWRRFTEFLADTFRPGFMDQAK